MTTGSDDGVLDARERARLHRHLARFPRHTCPVCEGKAWNASSKSRLDVHVPEIHHTAGETKLVTTMVVVALVCDACFFVRLFAWTPIATAAESEAR